MILAGNDGPLRRALAGMGAQATAADPWLSVASALSNVEAGELAAAQRRFDFLTMQCLVMLGVVAGTSGDLKGMRAVSTEALDVAADHGWQGSRWSATATAMLAYSDLLRSEAASAERLTAEGLRAGPAALPPVLNFIMQAFHGAATFDLESGRSGWPSCRRRARTPAPTRRERSSTQ